MRRPVFLLSLLAGAPLALGVAPSAQASPIGPSCGTCQGSIYGISYSGTAISMAGPTDTWRITLTIATAGYSGGGTHLDAVALKVSAHVVSANVITAPGGPGLWNETLGGLDASGCSGSGSGFDCVKAASPAARPAVPGGTYTWVFDLEIADGGLFTGPLASSIKARYVDAYGNKVGALVSENVTLSVPEPGLARLLAPVLLGVLGRRRR